MEKTTRGWTLAELARLLGGTTRGEQETQIVRPVPAGYNDPKGITFAESPEYLAKVLATTVGAVLVPIGCPEIELPSIEVQHPRAAFGRILAMCDRPLPLESGIHPTAIISPDARVAESAKVGAYAVIEAGAIIGECCRIYPFCYVGEGSELGSDVTLFPHSVLYQDVRIGNRSVIHSGVVIGADGFGFNWDSKNRNRRVKVPQVGSVIIGTDVEIGALTAVDRATAGSTVIGDGTKLDNLVQVAHNCVIGSHTVIAGQTAIGGSSNVGNRSDVGGQVAISDHVTVGDDIMLAGRTGVTNDILEPGIYWGLPAKPIMTAKRILASMVKLPDLAKRIKELEKRLAELEKNQS